MTSVSEQLDWVKEIGRNLPSVSLPLPALALARADSRIFFNSIRFLDRWVTDKVFANRNGFLSDFWFIVSFRSLNTSLHLSAPPRPCCQPSQQRQLPWPAFEPGRCCRRHYSSTFSRRESSDGLRARDIVTLVGLRSLHFTSGRAAVCFHWFESNWGLDGKTSIIFGIWSTRERTSSFILFTLV